MAIFRLNHAVLYVRDVTASVAFYRDVLGFGYSDGGDSHQGAAFLRAPDSTNDHDLGLFQLGPEAGPSGAGKSTVGLYHLAWEVDTLGDLEGQSDHGTSKSLYGKDPDGLEFEIVWIIPSGLLTDEDRERAGVSQLDLAAEVAKYGREARSGLGISRPND